MPQSITKKPRPNGPSSFFISNSYYSEERRLKTITNKKINITPTKIQIYHLLRNAQIPVVAVAEDTAAVVWAGFKSTERESDCETPETLILAVACFVAWLEIICDFPSKVIDFEVPVAIDPTLIPETMSPDTETPLT